LSELTYPTKSFIIETILKSRCDANPKMTKSEIFDFLQIPKEEREQGEWTGQQPDIA